MTPRRQAFVREVVLLIGTPYVLQGRVAGPQGGTDCPGPVLLPLWAIGAKPRSFDFSGYTSEPDGTMGRLCSEHMQPIALADVVPGDVLLCRWAGGAPRHLVVVIDRPSPGVLYGVEAVGPPDPRDPASPRRCGVRHRRVVFDSRGWQLHQAYRIPGLDEPGEAAA